MVETHSAFVAEAFSHALLLREPSGRWELGFQGFSLCAWGEPGPWPTLTGSGLLSGCPPQAADSVARWPVALASSLESGMRSHRLCSLETGKSWQVAFPGAFVFV